MFTWFKKVLLFKRTVAPLNDSSRHLSSHVHMINKDKICGLDPSVTIVGGHDELADCVTPRHDTSQAGLKFWGIRRVEHILINLKLP